MNTEANLRPIGKEKFKMDKRETVYRAGITRREIIAYTKAILFPIGIFTFGLFIIAKFGAFGTNIIAPAVSFMWSFGAFVAFRIPSQREGVLKETMTFVSGYFCGIMLLRFLIGAASTTSSTQIMATYSQAMPMSSNSTMSGFLQTSLWIIAFMTPVTFMGMEGKKLFAFHRSLAKNKVLEQTRSIRETEKRY